MSITQRVLLESPQKTLFSTIYFNGNNVTTYSDFLDLFQVLVKDNNILRVLAYHYIHFKVSVLRAVLSLVRILCFILQEKFILDLLSRDYLHLDLFCAHR